jgi:hypothetical protein
MSFGNVGKAAKAIDVFLKERSHWLSGASFTWLIVSITGYDAKVKKFLRLTADGQSKDHPISDDHAAHINAGGKANVTMGCGKSFAIN